MGTGPKQNYLLIPDSTKHEDDGTRRGLKDLLDEQRAV